MDQAITAAAARAVFWTNHRVQLTIPSVLAAGEEFRLKITVFGPEGLPAEHYRRPLCFEADSGVSGLPAQVAFAPGDRGCLEIGGLRAAKPGVVRITARPFGGPGVVCSNPARVWETPPWRLFWGDLHVHTVLSNCSAWACKSPEFAYEYARTTHLDFAAAADHLRGIHADPVRWPWLQRAARRFDQPGAFVPFLAFESSHRTGCGGDINAYYRDLDGPYFWCEGLGMEGNVPQVTLGDLWAFLDGTGQRYLTVPHHTGRAAKYRDFSDPVHGHEREPLFEIYSGWGSSECRWNRYPLARGNSEGPCYFRDALRAGCRYGVIASSDDHLTMPGGQGPAALSSGQKRLDWHIHRGLAAVRAPALTREALWEGLRGRDCYATTLDRALLDFRVDDIPAGRSAAVSRRDPLARARTVTVDYVPGVPEAAVVTVVRNGEEIARLPLDAAGGSLSWRDETPLEQALLRDAPFHPAPFAVYYLRVESGFGQTQWSSPVWLDFGS